MLLATYCTEEITDTLFEVMVDTPLAVSLLKGLIFDDEETEATSTLENASCEFTLDSEAIL
jgi:hypothetical protein